ncbi:MAG: hypothetical protein WD638_04065 [Nitriliruptoraceae bacterium]
MTTRVLEPGHDELKDRRARLLERAHMSREDLEAAAAAGTLSAEEFWLWEDIRSVEFLLGDDVEG